MIKTPRLELFRRILGAPFARPGFSMRRQTMHAATMSQVSANYDDHMEVSRRQFIMPGFITEKSLKLAKAFQPKDSDTFITSFPKSGTTWMQNVVYMLATNGNEDFQSIHHEFPWIDLGHFWDENDQPPNPWPKTFASSLNRRFMKSHTNWVMSPTEGNAKYIYIARKGDDALVSWYHFVNQKRPEVAANLKQDAPFEWHFEQFLTLKEPYLPFGDWFVHVMSFYQRSLEDRRILFVTYEDMKKDLFAICRKVADFAEFDVSDEQISALLPKMSFQYMKDNRAQYGLDGLDIWKTKKMTLLRKGEVGDHKVHLSAEQQERFDDKLKAVFAGTGLWGC